MILDTNALSALADGDSTIEPILRRTSEISIPVIVLGEYMYGVRQSHHRSYYETWLANLSPSYRVLTIEKETADKYASIRLELKRKGQSIPANDLWIGALARQHATPVLTRDKHFDVITGLKRIGW